MTKKSFLLLLIITVMLYLSCASTPKDISQKAFIFGMIECDEGGLDLRYVEFKSCSFNEKPKYYKSDVHSKKGYFWVNDVQLSSYRAVSFMHQDLMQKLGVANSVATINHIYEYGNGPLMVRITKPGVYYLGTYRYTKNPKKLSIKELLVSSPSTFNLEKVNNDNPKEILEWILKNKIRKSSPWYQVIERTINERSWYNAEDTIKL